jgi:hypothetical protein
MRTGIQVHRVIFVHAEEVSITCPICHETFDAQFTRPAPTKHFTPRSVTCKCRRYTYCHPDR